MLAIIDAYVMHGLVTFIVSSVTLGLFCLWVKRVLRKEMERAQRNARRCEVAVQKSEQARVKLQKSMRDLVEGSVLAEDTSLKSIINLH